MTSKLEQVVVAAIRDVFNTFDCESDEPPAVLLARAALTALNAEGYVIVPRVPTEAMTRPFLGRLGAGEYGDHEAASVWRQMIDAALASPSA